MDKRSIGEMRLETQLLQKRLEQVPEGETVTYADLSAVAGVNVQDEGRGLLRTARSNAEREIKSLFSVVFGVGLKRLSPNETASETGRATDHIRRTAKRAFARSAKADWSRMTPEAKAALNTERTLLHFAAQATTDKSRKKIENAVAAANDAINFQDTLKHFGAPAG